MNSSLRSFATCWLMDILLNPATCVDALLVCKLSFMSPRKHSELKHFLRGDLEGVIAQDLSPV